MKRISSVLLRSIFLWSPVVLSFSQTPLPQSTAVPDIFLCAILPRLQGYAMESSSWIHQTPPSSTIQLSKF